MSLQLGDRGCHARAVPANFMNGPAWGVGQRAGPPPLFPALHCAATCRAARCCLPAATWPAASRSAASDGAPEVPGHSPRHTASRQRVGPTTRPLGPCRVSILWSPFLGFLEWVLEAGGNEVSLQAPFPLGRQPWEVTDHRKRVDPYFGGRVTITLGRMEVQSFLGVLGF